MSFLFCKQPQGAGSRENVENRKVGLSALRAAYTGGLRGRSCPRPGELGDSWRGGGLRARPRRRGRTRAEGSPPRPPGRRSSTTTGTCRPRPGTSAHLVGSLAGPVPPLSLWSLPSCYRRGSHCTSVYLGHRTNSPRPTRRAGAVGEKGAGPTRGEDRCVPGHAGMCSSHKSGRGAGGKIRAPLSGTCSHLSPFYNCAAVPVPPSPFFSFSFFTSSSLFLPSYLLQDFPCPSRNT
jgi:hypothetical protein